MTLADYGIKNIVNGRSTCPQCSHKRKPSNQSVKCLAVNEKEGVWLCHHCGFKGSLKKSDYKVFNPKAEQTEKFFKFFESRAIGKLTLATFGVGMDGKEIKYPYFYNGICVNNKYETRTKDGGKKYRQEKEAKKIFYNIDAVDNCNEVYIVEGEKDVLSLYEAGIKNVISIPDGALNPANKSAKDYNKKFSYIDNCIEKLKNIERFILFLDNDENGNYTKNLLAERLNKYKCYFVDNDTDYKDANDILQNLGKEYLINLCEFIKPFPVKNIISISDVKDKILFNLTNPDFDRVTTNSPKIDNLIRKVKGNLILVNGRPNHGKSTWLLDYLVRLNIYQGYKTLIYSGEHEPQSTFEKLLQQLIGKPVRQKFNGHANILQITEMMKYIEDNFKVENESLKSIDYYIEQFTLNKFRYGFDCFVIDNVSKTSDSSKDIEVLINGINKLSKFAKDTNSAMFVVVHPRKVRENSEYPEKTQNRFPMPSLSDIYGTSFFENLADIGINFFLDKGNFDETQKSEWRNIVHVEKVREEGLNGFRGKVALKLEKSNERYLEIGQNKFINYFD